MVPRSNNNILYNSNILYDSNILSSPIFDFLIAALITAERQFFDLPINPLQNCCRPKNLVTLTNIQIWALRVVERPTFL